jgi:hypothetical protein
MRAKISLPSSAFAAVLTLILVTSSAVSYAQAADMSLVKPKSIETKETEEYPYNPSANGDNLTDIIAFNTTNFQIDVTPSTGVDFGGGINGFQVWNTNSGYNPRDWKLLKPADVDGDGDADIIAFNKNTTQIDVTLSNTADYGGGWRGYQVWNRNSGYSANSWILLDPSDVNGDARADVIAFNPRTRQIDVTLSFGTNFGGGYKGYQVWNTNSGYSTADWQLLSPADANGDLMADIIALNPKTQQVDVTLSTGLNYGGGWKGYQVWNSNSGYSASWTLLPPADVNGDWMADLVAWNRNLGQINITESNGNSFGGGAGGSIPVIVDSGYLCTPGYPCYWKFLDPSDVNGDGFDDIIAYNGTRVYVNQTESSETEVWYSNTEAWNSSTGYNSKWILLN